MIYAIQFEMAIKPNDILCRRLPIAFVNEEASIEILPRVVELMAIELNWDSNKQKEEYDNSIKYLRSKK